MSNIKYNVMFTGSKGNAVLVNNILIDIGVSYKKISDSVKDVRLLLITHKHSDHINKSAVRKIVSENPFLRIGVGGYLLELLLELGIKRDIIDVLDAGIVYDYGLFKIKPVSLYHEVPNMGYKIKFADGGRCFYATDTSSLKNITAKAYDLYMVEANYTAAALQDRINKKVQEGKYVYDYKVPFNHLSIEQANVWIMQNSAPKSEIVLLHEHIDS